MCARAHAFCIGLCNRIKNIRVFFVIIFICLTVSAYLRYINDCCIQLIILLCLQCCSIIVYNLFFELKVEETKLLQVTLLTMRVPA